jgi:signal transduction histidine kinase
MAKGAKVLVVDDNPTTRMALVFGVQFQGHEVTEAENGQQALDLLRAAPFDLVMLDVEMPILNGYQVLEQIKKDPTLQSIPVIVISAVDEMESIVKCIQMGAEDYLPKPFEPVLLRARIGAGLEKKHRHDQEVEYLQQVSQLAEAAAAVEAETFNPDSLASIVARSDPLGQLARVFQRMANEIRAREADLKQQNKVKSAFIGAITHELRSPFVSAALSAELLQQYAENNMFNELKAQTRQLNRELSEGRRMIDTILSFAALMNQETPLNRQPTNFEVLVHEAVSPLISLAVIHQIKLSFDIAAQLPLVSVDKDQMSEAIYHLAHNAIKFNRSGGSVLIYCYMIDTDLYVEVTDSGIGIAADKLATIWDTFIQTADEGRRGVEGLGLGLAIVKLTIEAHGGEVIAKSTLGAGSTFGFRLPLAV